MEGLQAKNGGVDDDPWQDEWITQVQEAIEEKQVYCNVHASSGDSGFTTVFDWDVAVVAVPISFRDVVLVIVNVVELVESFTERDEGRQQAEPVAKNEGVLGGHVSTQNLEERMELVLEWYLPNVDFALALQFFGI